MQENTVLDTRDDTLTSEEKWLEWLLMIWDANGRRPSWITLKSKWPDECQAILKDVGSWRIVEVKLQAAYDIREEKRQESEREKLRSLSLGERKKYYTIEDFLLGLEKMMNWLQIERIPTQKELEDFASVLGIPSSAAYSRTLLEKKNWMSYLERYRSASSEKKQEVLNEIELELRKKKVERRKKRDISMKPGVKGYTEEDCLEALCRMQEFLSIDTIPNGPQIRQCRETLDLPSEKTFRNVLGPRPEWPDMLAKYKEKKAIREFLATYNDLETGDELKIDHLLSRMLKTLTLAEKLEWSSLCQKVEMATYAKPATCTVRVNGKDYEIAIKPLG